MDTGAYNETLQIETFMPEEMIERMRPFARKGECVFYGQRPPEFKYRPDCW